MAYFDHSTIVFSDPSRISVYFTSQAHFMVLYRGMRQNLDAKKFQDRYKLGPLDKNSESAGGGGPGTVDRPPTKTPSHLKNASAGGGGAAGGGGGAVKNDDKVEQREVDEYEAAGFTGGRDMGNGWEMVQPRMVIDTGNPISTGFEILGGDEIDAAKVQEQEDKSGRSSFWA